MNVTNATEAADWVRAWRHDWRRGVAQATIDGLRRCEAISKSQGRVEMAQNYREALEAIEREVERRAQ